MNGLIMDHSEDSVDSWKALSKGMTWSDLQA